MFMILCLGDIECVGTSDWWRWSLLGLVADGQPVIAALSVPNRCYKSMPTVRGITS